MCLIKVKGQGQRSQIIVKITPANINYHQNTARVTRQQSGPCVLEVPQFNKICYQYSLYPRTTREWNLLPPGIRSITDLNNFKNNLNKIDIDGLVSKAHYKV